MGRTRLYPDNASRQRAFQQKQKDKQLQQQIEAAQKTNSNQANQKVINLEELIKYSFYGHTLAEVKEAYEHYKSMYKSIGVDVLFSEIHRYLDDETPLVHSIKLGEIELFLSMFDPHIECPICGYFRSILEKACPDCRFKIENYKEWKEWRRQFPD